MSRSTSASGVATQSSYPRATGAIGFPVHGRPDLVPRPSSTVVARQPATSARGFSHPHSRYCRGVKALTIERLLLEPWDERYREPWRRICRDREVMRFIGRGDIWEQEQADEVRRGHEASLAGFRASSAPRRASSWSRSRQLSSAPIPGSYEPWHSVSRAPVRSRFGGTPGSPVVDWVDATARWKSRACLVVLADQVQGSCGRRHRLGVHPALHRAAWRERGQPRRRSLTP